MWGGHSPLAGWLARHRAAAERREGMNQVYVVERLFVNGSIAMSQMAASGVARSARIDRHPNRPGELPELFPGAMKRVLCCHVDAAVWIVRISRE
jgi:hypothetical protein